MAIDQNWRDIRLRQNFAVRIGNSCLLVNIMVNGISTTQ